MRQVKALVVTGFGINCEEETAAAWRLAGASADIVHLNDVLQGRVSLDRHDAVSLPGGFSFGDDLGAGKALANRIRYKPLPCGGTLFDELARFLERGGFILGICNGFQALVKMGLLPNTGGAYEQEVSLTTNDSGRFEGRWCRLSFLDSAPARFLGGLPPMELPVRHKEGRMVTRDEQVRSRIVELSLNCMAYCDEGGASTSEYPLNPNGSELCCAGLCDVTGRVLGLMPHPEACLSLYNYPDWGSRRRRGERNEEGAGLRFFRAIVDNIRRDS
ncbi:MAG: phosphoribosylformylglycinamidine synthase subunit PurQ [Deltaproteobacteria bacterium]|nr:phosphoribosylformylglycinamidine synthase subunit PurQ [Deltaproteobacteria bacterium]